MTGQTDSPRSRGTRRFALCAKCQAGGTCNCDVPWQSSLRSSKRIAAAGTGTMAHFDRVASLQQLPADGLRRPLKLASNLQNFQKIFLVFND